MSWVIQDNSSLLLKKTISPCKICLKTPHPPPRHDIPTEHPQWPHICQSGIILQSGIVLQPRKRLQAMLPQLLVWEQKNFHRYFSRILIPALYHIHPQLYKSIQVKRESSPSILKTHALRKRATYTAPAGSLSSLLGFPHCWWLYSCSSLSPLRGSSRW